MDNMIYEYYIKLCKKLNIEPTQEQYLEYKYHVLIKFYNKII